MGRKIKIETVKRRLDYIVKNFETEIVKIEAECKVDIYHFPYLDIIIRDNKQYVFPNNKQHSPLIFNKK